MNRQYPPYRPPSSPTPGWAKFLIVMFFLAIVVGLVLQVLKDIYPEWFK